MATLRLNLQYNSLLQVFPSESPVKLDYCYDAEGNREYEIGLLQLEVSEWCYENLAGIPLVKLLPAIYEFGEMNYFFELVFENEVDLIFFKMRWSV